MQTYIVKVSGSILNVSNVHLNGIWHLIWRYLSKPVLGGHPVLSGNYSIPEGVRLIQVSLYTVLLMLKSGQLIRFGNVVIVMINADTWVMLREQIKIAQYAKLPTEVPMICCLQHI